MFRGLLPDYNLSNPMLILATCDDILNFPRVEIAGSQLKIRQNRRRASLKITQ